MGLQILKSCLMVSMIFSGLAAMGYAVESHPEYGIHGQKAPELDVPYWVNGKGQALEGDHQSFSKGKINYLLFFQDW